MRHREPLTPDEARELDAIDLALAGEPVDPDLRELEDLVDEVRATAPPMSAALTARLERIADHGPEPVAAPSGAAKPRRSRRWLLMPALGTVAAMVVALVVVLSNDNRTSPTSSVVDNAVGDGPAIGETLTPKSGAGGTQLDAPAAVDRRVQRTESVPAPTAATGAAPALAPQSKRKVERSVFLVLETPKDKLESTAEDVTRTVHRFRGIIASSSVRSDPRSGGEANYDLRIPTARLDDALAALSELGHVVERRQDLEDITSSFTSTQDRLDEARAERRGLLKALGNATTQTKIESIRARLRLVRGQIGSANRQMTALQRRANYSRVSITVRGDAKADQGGGGTWSPGDAANDALRVLEVIAGVALIAVAVAIPLALLGLAILFGARVSRSRRRESALDAT